MHGARFAFLRSFAAVAAAALVSIYLQLPGLVGPHGLTPLSPTASPPLLAALLPHDGGFPTLLALEATALAGFAAAALALACRRPHGALFLAIFCAQCVLFRSVQPWLGFQWDILLLETAAAAAFYAPWGPADDSGPTSHPMSWVLRAQAVKFMLMSGVVKVTADCPTWKHLTALEFHFASAPLPTAEAWLFHSLPPTLLRLGVAFMFVCELIAPWLLIAPCTPARRVGVFVQLALQLGIMLTGNYNWFNAHTAVLMLPAWEADALHGADVGATRLGWGRLLVAPLQAWERAWASRLGRAVGGGAALTLLAAASAQLFPVRYNPEGGDGLLGALARPNGFEVSNHADREFVAWLLSSAITVQSILYLYMGVAIAAVGYALPSPSPPAAEGRRRPLAVCIAAAHTAWRVAVGAAALVWLGVTLLPARVAHQHAGGPAPARLGRRARRRRRDSRRTAAVPRVVELRALPENDGRGFVDGAVGVGRRQGALGRRGPRCRCRG